MTTNKASNCSVQTSTLDGVLVTAIHGEVDIASADHVGTVIADQLETHPPSLVIELDVTFLGSAGLSMLLELYGRAQREGVGFAVVVTDATARRPLVATGLDQVLPLADTVDDAVREVTSTP